MIGQIFVLSIIPTHAFAITNLPENGVELQAMYYTNARASLSISSTGLATAVGKIYGISGTTTNTTVHLYLQKYTDGAWETVDDWISKGETVNRVLTKTKQVTKGYKYRVKASCYAYKDSAYEHVTKYSSSVTY